jgi:hypothetical protein
LHQKSSPPGPLSHNLFFRLRLRMFLAARYVNIEVVSGWTGLIWTCHVFFLFKPWSLKRASESLSVTFILQDSTWTESTQRVTIYFNFILLTTPPLETLILLHWISSHGVSVMHWLSWHGVSLGVDTCQLSHRGRIKLQISRRFLRKPNPLTYIL